MECLHAGVADLPKDGVVRHFRQQGVILAFDAVVDDAERAATFSRRFFTTALQHELLMRPIGRTVYMMPPYILEQDELSLLARKTKQVFEEVMA